MLFGRLEVKLISMLSLGDMKLPEILDLGEIMGDSSVFICIVRGGKMGFIGRAVSEMVFFFI